MEHRTFEEDYYTVSNSVEDTIRISTRIGKEASQRWIYYNFSNAEDQTGYERK